MSFLSKWGFGVDLDAEQARGDAFDSALAKVNTADYSPGGRIYNQIQAGQGTAVADRDYAAVNGNLGSGQTGDVTGSVGDEFKAGWVQGEENILGAVKGTINTVGGQAFKVAFGAIPAWLWIVGIIVLLFYTGIGQAIVRKSTK